jgi:hypothetical protein
LRLADPSVVLVTLAPIPPQHPDLRRHLLYEIDEELYAEQTHHWALLLVSLSWVAAGFASLGLFLLGTAELILALFVAGALVAVWLARRGGSSLRPLALAGGAGLVLWLTRNEGDIHAVPAFVMLACLARGIWLWAVYHYDIFAVTDTRVLRLRGPLSKKRATVPLGRILDIVVEKPLLGQVMGYGHLVFESAAQVQGLREIRFMPHPDTLDRTIQLLVHGGPPPRAETHREPEPEPQESVDPVDPDDGAVLRHRWLGRVDPRR